MGFSRNRLRRLEHAAGCPECALPPSEAAPARIVVVYEDSPAPASVDFPDDPSERCGSCDRPLWTIIRVVYEDAADKEGGGVTPIG